MRIALVAEGTRGDIQPLLALAEALAARGEDAWLCAPPDFAEAAAAHGVCLRPLGRSVRSWAHEHARIFRSGPLAVLREATRYTREALPAQLRELPELTAGAELIVGGGLAFGAASAAELHGAAYRYIAYCPALFPSGEHAPAMLGMRPRGRRWNRAFGRLLVLAQNLALGPLLNRARGELGLPPVRALLEHFLGEQPLLAADPALAPLPADCAGRAEQVPYLIPETNPGPLPEKLQQFLDAGQAPVYLGFGSMPDADPDATTREVVAAAERVGCRLLLGAGWAGLGGGPLPESVLRLEPIDHALVFPRVAAVVHHGGAGTTTQAARAGVPQLIVSHLMDQPFWGHRVAALGLGPPPLSRRRLQRERLAERLGVMLDNEVLAERAAEVGARLRREASLEPAIESLLRGPQRRTR